MLQSGVILNVYENIELVKHPDKHIREALKHAAEQGWTIKKVDHEPTLGVQYAVASAIASVLWRSIQHQETLKITRDIL